MHTYGSDERVYDNFHGRYVNGKREGYGEHTLRRREGYYKGQYKNGLRHGENGRVGDKSGIMTNVAFKEGRREGYEESQNLENLK